MENIEQGIVALVAEEAGLKCDNSFPRRSWTRRVSGSYTTCQILFKVICIIFILSTGLFFLAINPTAAQTWQSEEPETEVLVSKPLLIDPGWRIIEKTTGSPLAVPNTKERVTLAEIFLGARCTEKWISSGELCDPAAFHPISKEMKESLKLSVVHTWVNGSDSNIRRWKEKLAQDETDEPLNHIGNAARHFRPHGELVHSMRSAFRSLRQEDLADLHLVTTDLPLDQDTSIRIGQTPGWLSLDGECTPRVRAHYHWELFKARGGEINEEQAETWRERALPTFNSIGIESQLVTLAPELTDTMLYFNDDFFLTRNLTRSDFASPLFGSVFRMQNDLQVSSTAKGISKADLEGEWPSLGYSNWLLDQRFGARSRPYLQHFVKSFPTPLMEEISSIWGQELTESAEERFRGASHGKALSLAFLVTHFVVERHREALLWSFVVARSDRDNSRTLDWAERHNLLSDIGYSVVEHSTETPTLIIPQPLRQFKTGVEDILTQAGLAPPNATHYSFTSHQGGYAYTQLKGRPVLNEGGHYVLVKDVNPPNNGWPQFQSRDAQEKPDSAACTLDVLDCFGDRFMADSGDIIFAQDTLKRVAFEKPHCGDCIITSLLIASGEAGFSAFLPPPSRKGKEAERVALSMSKEWTDAHYDTLGGRKRAVSLLQRYSYVIGDSASQFVPIQASRTLAKHFGDLLKSVYTSDGPAFVALNDELSDQTTKEEVDGLDRQMRNWMDTIWPEKMCWES